MENNLLRWRQIKELTVKDIAEKTGFSIPYIYGIERNERRLNEDFLRALNKHYNADINYILGLDTSETIVELTAGTKLADLTVKEFLEILNIESKG
jgi:transcriptional regulator with XRE-family HTH domain